jgi:hypothetical protein
LPPGCKEIRLQRDLVDHRWPMSGTKADPSAIRSAASPAGKVVTAAPSSRVIED